MGKIEIDFSTLVACDRPVWVCCWCGSPTCEGGRECEIQHGLKVEVPGQALKDAIMEIFDGQVVIE